MKYIIIVLFFFNTSLKANAETDSSEPKTDEERSTVEYIAPKKSNIFSLGWNSATTFSQKEFAGQNSWRGGEFDFQSYIKPNITLGFAFMWSRFTDKRERETYQKGTALINAVSWRYLEVNPILVTLGYRKKFSSIPKLKWHLGLGTGAYSIYQRMDFGIYVASERVWSWGVTPTAGITYWFEKNTAVAFNLKYNFVKYDKFNYNNIQMLVYNLAISFSVN